MSKRFGLILIVLLIAPMVLTACGKSDSQEAAEDYMNAVLKGETEKAQEKACADYQDYTAQLVAGYQALTPDIDTEEIDLKFDVGKGQNEEEIIVTGSYEYGNRENPEEYELVGALRLDEDDQEKLGLEENSIDTRAVLMMKEEDGDWCVSAESKFTDPLLLRAISGGDVEAPAGGEGSGTIGEESEPEGDIEDASGEDEGEAEATEAPAEDAAEATAEATAEAE